MRVAVNDLHHLIGSEQANLFIGDAEADRVGKRQIINTNALQLNGSRNRIELIRGLEISGRYYHAIRRDRRTCGTRGSIGLKFNKGVRNTGHLTDRHKGFHLFNSALLLPVELKQLLGKFLDLCGIIGLGHLLFYNPQVECILERIDLLTFEFRNRFPVLGYAIILITLPG